MIYKPKGSPYLRVKFQWHGKLINVGTKTEKEQDARIVESAIRRELALERYSVLAPKPKPTLAEFLKEDFLPYARTKHAPKPKTLKYYEHGASMLEAARIAKESIDKITDKHAQHFIAEHAPRLKPTTINCGLRTLRVALRLAERFGQLDHAPRLSLASGERQRDRVLTREEEQAYLTACNQPWRDCALLIIATGLRPNEAFTLTWPQLVMTKDKRYAIRVLEGKSKAAKRFVPLLPAAVEMLTKRHEEQGRPKAGWVFPSGSRQGHLEQGTCKTQHARALTKSGVAAFEPYCLRHTALTRLAPHCDPFTLARIAGHSSITITQRYAHPEDETIQRAFDGLEGRKQLGDGTERKRRQSKRRPAKKAGVVTKTPK